MLPISLALDGLSASVLDTAEASKSLGTGEQIPEILVN